MSLDQAPLTWTVRRHQPNDDPDALAGLLAATFAPEPLAQWLAPDDDTRLGYGRAYIAGLVAAAVHRGTVYLATDDPGGSEEIVGVALWHPCAPPIPTTASRERPPGATTEDDLRADLPPAVRAGMTTLDRVLRALHPEDRAHHHLAYLGVREDRQNAGIGSALLAHHHAVLDLMGISAYLEATHPDNQRLYARHGYRDFGAPMQLPRSDTSIWPMWRSPQPTQSRSVEGRS